ncbi:hypothetical protein BZA05DRAFT_421607 [Tricharina praecox]|uniref:uncharacterized protein n=1 Tax=Tricharina praecox TaxID=43433 RepID=UPI00221F812C|nr:uncharacterized protein BZA05DRAFT_421607 [Tricharina praecox]KAI5844936.1 hypothetical protein BZA05DRAFT_421607 [Tricharina praecox]
MAARMAASCHAAACAANSLSGQSFPHSVFSHVFVRMLFLFSQDAHFHLVMRFGGWSPKSVCAKELTYECDSCFIGSSTIHPASQAASSRVTANAAPPVSDKQLAPSSAGGHYSGRDASKDSGAT